MVLFLILFSLKKNKISDNSKNRFQNGFFQKYKTSLALFNGKCIIAKMWCLQIGDSVGDRFRGSSLNTS